MRYLITGAGGMLATDLAKQLSERVVKTFNRSEWDITDPTTAAANITADDVVINCAAYNLVDRAETDRDAAWATNATGPRMLADACREAGATLVHFSSDYVFGTNNSQPHDEFEEVSPASVYEESKAAGEQECLNAHPDGTYVLRTAWLYGAHGDNFPRAILRRLRAGETVDVVNDQVGQPTWTEDLAAQTIRLLEANAPTGIYHATNAGEASWWEFAQAVAAADGIDPQLVRGVSSAEFVRPARRPEYSVLSHHRWAEVSVPAMRHWREALDDATRAGVFAR